VPKFVADSVETTGLKWVAAPVASDPNLTLLNTGGTALTGATTITVNVSSFNNYFIHINNGSSANASSELRLRFNTDDTAKYQWAAVGDQAGSVFAASTFEAGTNIRLSKMGNSAADTWGDVMVKVIGGKTSGIKVVDWNSRAFGSTTNQQLAGTGFYTGTSAITSISVISSTGNFDSGTVFVYGG
jgi:hypothetical protein